jgi:hypothetical protein
MSLRSPYWQATTVEERGFGSMFVRCYSKASPSFERYGGRGIHVCPRWSGPFGLQLFLDDMGPEPTPEHSLDRINNDGIYEPENCRWATAKEQANNKKQRDWRTDDCSYFRAKSEA